MIMLIMIILLENMDNELIKIILIMIILIMIILLCLLPVNTVLPNFHCHALSVWFCSFYLLASVYILASVSLVEYALELEMFGFSFVLSLDTV